LVDNPNCTRKSW